MVEETEEKEAKQSKTTLNVSFDKTQAIIIALVIALGISVYFNLQPTGMVTGDVNGGTGNGDVTDGFVADLESRTPIESPYETFEAVSGDIYEEDGKPLVIMFSSDQCSHCVWIKDTFDAVVEEYAADGKITAYHWNDGTNILTDNIDLGMPREHEYIFAKFSMGGYIPTFVFGCKYYRVGTGYEGKWSSGELTEEEALQKEAELFRQIIDDMLSE